LASDYVRANNDSPQLAALTPSSEVLTPQEARLIAPYFTNTDRSIVALRNLPEAVKGALFSRYSRTSKGVRRLFLDEFLNRADLEITPQVSPRQSLVAGEKAAAFYQRILADYGDDSVGELGGAHLACQEVSQLAAKAIEDNRIGLSFLEKSSRYVPFDDRVNGRFRYYRPRRVLDSPAGAEYVAALDDLFASYSRHLPDMIAQIGRRFPLETMTFEVKRPGGVDPAAPSAQPAVEMLPFSAIADEELRRVAQAAYHQAVRARACDALRCFLPLATLSNVGVWGNGRALEYLLTKLYADPLEEIQIIAHAAQFELDQVIGPFVRRANDEKGRLYQDYLRQVRQHQRDLAGQYLSQQQRPAGGSENPGSIQVDKQSDKVTLVRYDPDAVERVVAAILYPASDWPKTAILARVQSLSDEEKAHIIRAYVGDRRNRRHKPGRAFEATGYDFDLLLNIGEYRDLQRHRILSPSRQAFTPDLGYEINDDVAAVPEIRADYERCLERVTRLYHRLVGAMPFEAQYVVPYGCRVRYNLQMNLREAFHLIELRSAPQGHPDYRRTVQAIFRAIQAVHPLLAEGMTFVDLTPDVPIGRLRAEMRRAEKQRM